MFNKFKLYARFKGDRTPFYTSNANYTLIVQVGKFNGVFKVLAIDRDTSHILRGSQRHYENKSLFEKDFSIIADKSDELDG